MKPSPIFLLIFCSLQSCTALAESFRCEGVVKFEDGSSRKNVSLNIEISGSFAKINGVGFKSEPTWVSADGTMRTDRQLTEYSDAIVGWTAIMSENNIGSYKFHWSKETQTLVYESNDMNVQDFKYTAKCE